MTYVHTVARTEAVKRTRRTLSERRCLNMMSMLWRLNDRVARVLHREDAQGLAEYALILALIAIVAIVALIFLGGQVSTILSKVGKSI
jgi:pilus assembly protein Flp/PilA